MPRSLFLGNEAVYEFGKPELVVKHGFGIRLHARVLFFKLISTALKLF